MSENRHSERLSLIPVFIFAFEFTLAITPAPVEAQSALWQSDKNVELIVGTTPGYAFHRSDDIRAETHVALVRGEKECHCR